MYDEERKDRAIGACVVACEVHQHGCEAHLRHPQRGRVSRLGEQSTLLGVWILSKNDKEDENSNDGSKD